MKEAKITLGRTGEKQTLRLEGRLTIEYAADIAEALKGAVGSSRELVIDLSGAEDADISMLQLLCATHKKAHSEGRKVELAGCSAAFLQRVGALGYIHKNACSAVMPGACLWSLQDSQVPNV